MSIFYEIEFAKYILPYQVKSSWDDYTITFAEGDY